MIAQLAHSRFAHDMSVSSVRTLRGLEQPPALACHHTRPADRLLQGLRRRVGRCETGHVINNAENRMTPGTLRSVVSGR